MRLRWDMFGVILLYFGDYDICKVIMLLLCNKSNELIKSYPKFIKNKIKLTTMEKQFYNRQL